MLSADKLGFCLLYISEDKRFTLRNPELKDQHLHWAERFNDEESFNCPQSCVAVSNEALGQSIEEAESVRRMTL
jgi:hypothetical protein